MGEGRELLRTFSLSLQSSIGLSSEHIRPPPLQYSTGGTILVQMNTAGDVVQRRTAERDGVNARGSMSAGGRGGRKMPVEM